MFLMKDQLRLLILLQLNDVSREVVVILDKEILGGDILNFHPNINTATIQISKDDLSKFLNWAGNEVREVEI